MPAKGKNFRAHFRLFCLLCMLSFLSGFKAGQQFQVSSKVYELRAGESARRV